MQPLPTLYQPIPHTIIRETRNLKVCHQGTVPKICLQILKHVSPLLMEASRVAKLDLWFPTLDVKEILPQSSMVACPKTAYFLGELTSQIELSGLCPFPPTHSLFSSQKTVRARKLFSSKSKKQGTISSNSRYPKHRITNKNETPNNSNSKHIQLRPENPTFPEN